MLGEDFFKALVVRKVNGRFSNTIEKKQIKELPEEELLIRVNYTNINFKDGMSCKGNPSITRRFPHTPGIDACGTVISSSNPQYRAGEKVVIICQPMGLNSPGGFAEFIRIKSSWAIKIGEEINQETIMAIGTAGITAALAIKSLINSENRLPNKIIVSGASGGIGSVSISILKHLGVNITALTSSRRNQKFLESLEVNDIIYADDYIKSTKQNLALSKWDGAIDVVGGDTLSSLIKSINPGGSVACTGNVQSTSFSNNVLPFIIRGISLNGINAEMQKKSEREKLIKKINNEWLPKNLSKIYKTISLSQLPSYLDLFNKREIFGRIVVKTS